MSGFGDIRKDYESLVKLPPDADGEAKRRRGYAFERLLNKLFSFEELEPRSSYQLAGEQIDGSIYFDGRFYLLEAKWHSEPLPASTIYQFKGKVDGKLAGTLGIFISMSGYAEDAVDALTLGKGLNVILVDSSDMDAAIRREYGIKKVLKTKIRMAAEKGVIYFPVEGSLVTADKTRVVEINDLRYDHIIGGIAATQKAEPASADLLIVCEGSSDRVIISTLAERILARADSDRSIKVFTAMGKMAIPRVANALRNTYNSESKVLIVTDGDNDPVGASAMLRDNLEFSEWLAAIPNPSIEAWLGYDINNPMRGKLGRSGVKKLRQEACEVDIDNLINRDKSFSILYESILGI